MEKKPVHIKDFCNINDILSKNLIYCYSYLRLFIDTELVVDYQSIMIIVQHDKSNISLLLGSIKQLRIRFIFVKILVLEKEIKNIFSTLSVMFLSVGFLGVGMLKLVSLKEIVDSFDKWHIPQVFRYLIGLMEVGLAVTLYYKPTRRMSMLICFIHMLGATSIHLYYNEASQLYGPVTVLVLLAIMFYSDNSNKI